MSARRYLVVVQDPRGYPAHSELEPAPPEGPKQPMIHMAVLADDFEAMEARALAAEKRNGPRPDDEAAIERMAEAMVREVTVITWSDSNCEWLHSISRRLAYVALAAALEEAP